MKECIKKLCGKIKENMRIKRFPLFKEFPEIESTLTGLDNILPKEFYLNCEYIATEILRPLRKRFPKLLITSWYRSPAVNSKVGGVSKSSHLKAQGVDVSGLPGTTVATLFKWIKKNLKVDYIKMYPTHIHITKRNKAVK